MMILTGINKMVINSFIFRGERIGHNKMGNHTESKIALRDFFNKKISLVILTFMKINVITKQLYMEVCSMKPTKENLTEVIKNGDDSHDNVLVRNLDGSFELLNGAGVFIVEEEKGNNYVVRCETFDAGNDYVGENASKDNKHIGNIYSWALRYWDEYKKTGKYPLLNMEA